MTREEIMRTKDIRLLAQLWAVDAAHMAKERSLSVRLDPPTEERLAAVVRMLSERGPEPSTSQVVRHAIDELYAKLTDDSGRSGARDEGRVA